MKETIDIGRRRELFVDRYLYGDELDAAVSWKGGELATLAGQPVRLRFVLKDADLFALRSA
jgi:hypothetical protein